MTHHYLRLLSPDAAAGFRRKHRRMNRPSPYDLPPAGFRVLRITDPPGERQLTQRLNAILEVLAGRRAAGQIRPLVDDALFSRLATQDLLPGIRYHVAGDLRLCRPADSALEASTTIHAGLRVYALAARFERTRIGWICTRFHVLAPRANLAQSGRAAA
ncbi:Rv3235 family protein [Amycolatopsis jejuensis]|uniref:Rv3235 family protein n=1 Tax=Amycolatopsis jejuensis TaxID=330084 RepID=UPI0005265CD5|nr:Rv3235 family protein [Amycolatopsis jejuensis]